MQTRILDLDGSVARQSLLLRRTGAAILNMRAWGPRIRIACRHGSFARFEKQLAQIAGSQCDQEPYLTFVGSGDFHHVSLALLRRLPGPFNLMVIDNHPDWMRGIPLLHCGTWLYHASQLPGLQRIFHLGGAVDFNNAYRWLAPWPMIRSGKIVVGPARQRFRGRSWDKIAHRPVRFRPDEPAGHKDIKDWLLPYRAELAASPLYISLDKDVLSAAEAPVNWDSGHLTLPEVLTILEIFWTAAGGQLRGMDIVGDWSPPQVQGLLRRLMHWIEHPALAINPDEANQQNETLNIRLFNCISSLRLAA